MVGLMLAAAVAVSSQVTDVTVFSDRAQVVRTAHVELVPGMNQLRFEGLPESVDSRGIQVDGAGAATVLDVRFRVEELNEVSREEWKSLYDERDELRLEKRRLVQKIEVLTQAKQLLAKIGNKVTHTAETENEPELDPGQWEKMLLLHMEKSQEYNEAILIAEVKLVDVGEALANVEDKIKALGADSRKLLRVVEVDLEAAQAGEVELQLSYLVRGPKWVPTYDIRVDSESRKLDVKYFALVRQNTGEDWGDVALKLSTANPGLGGRHEELQAWRINMISPQQDKSVGFSSRPWVGAAEYSVAENAYSSEPYDADGSSFDTITSGIAAPVPAVKARKTRVQSKGASIVFEVPGACCIESDNVEHRVAVSSTKLDAHFRYSTAPKLDAYAYLKARAVNQGEHPFLEGQANVYLDGSFVTATPLELVAPGEEFWVFLGADESVKVEHKLVKRYQSKEGLRGHTIRHTYEYLISVKNTHAVPEEVIVWDQLPISGSEGLEVKLLEPKYSKDTASLKLDDEQRISWFKTLEPGESWEIPFSFYVEAPKGMTINGLK